MLYKCAITGKKARRSIFGCHRHHFILQQNYKKYRHWYEEAGIKQQTFWLHYECHADLHSLNDNKFFLKYGKERSDFLFNKAKYLRGLLF